MTENNSNFNSAVLAINGKYVKPLVPNLYSILKLLVVHFINFTTGVLFIFFFTWLIYIANNSNYGANQIDVLLQSTESCIFISSRIAFESLQQAFLRLRRRRLRRRVFRKLLLPYFIIRKAGSAPSCRPVTRRPSVLFNSIRQTLFPPLPWPAEHEAKAWIYIHLHRLNYFQINPCAIYKLTQTAAATLVLSRLGTLNFRTTENRFGFEYLPL